MEVLDAETGEKVIIQLPGAAVHQSQPDTTTTRPQQQQQQQRQHQHIVRKHEVNPATQTERQLGDRVRWSQLQSSKVQCQRAERRFRESLEGVRWELQRKDLTADQRRALEVELLEKTKQHYAQHVRALVTEEMEREMERQVQLQLELSAIGRERIKKRHDQERTFYRTQIERVKLECEMGLTSTMAQLNFLR
ncbi:TPA: hypothetical protein N0F65_004049 [Lagenidium giganteum]|uniref:Uncharacterized protein n=1 Tax=Lagenidium giganteum TaxID=4803 RepID=A0AAV2Z0T4_9STRA|nr:TPA: hypothetical protein N0F65_004049 [Lagenidium giganteum]